MLNAQRSESLDLCCYARSTQSTAGADAMAVIMSFVQLAISSAFKLTRLRPEAMRRCVVIYLKPAASARDTRSCKHAQLQLQVSHDGMITSGPSGLQLPRIILHACTSGMYMHSRLTMGLCLLIPIRRVAHKVTSCLARILACAPQFFLAAPLLK